MVIQTGLAFYVLLVASPGSDLLPSLSALIFIAGGIKYGERLSTLCAANRENFRDSMLPEPDPGPNYAKFMEEYALKEAEGFSVSVDEVEEIQGPAQHDFPDEPSVREAYDLFLTFKRLFADTILSFQDRDRSKSYFMKLDGEQAFKVVETELGFMFDELYTKASTVYNLTATGCFLKMITFSLTLIAWMVFIFVCDKGKYKVLDLVITHLLLGVAVFLEIYAVGALVNSDWTRRLRVCDRSLRTTSFARVILWFQPVKKRWSEKAAQHNLLDLCVGNKFAVLPRSIRKVTRIYHYFKKQWHKSFVDVSIDLKRLIFEELKSYTNCSAAAMWNRRGSFTLERYTSLCLDKIKEGEFDQRILLWHIATDLCYSLEPPDNKTALARHSKPISEYMLCLLVVYPFMLPMGIGMIRFRDTCAEAEVFFRERGAMIYTKGEACKKLLEVSTQVKPAKVKGDRSKTVLFDACMLAKSLLDVKVQSQRWEIISKVWVEMLAHAATHCSGHHHAHQLRKGGELLSHVWLLMTHLGITEQFQISQGHARAKMQAK
ncbi:uncharacterized protein LOC121771260 [Salvia splendens]|nr:uncharacterized protein LOC121771260 [Salvia splendens]